MKKADIGVALYLLAAVIFFIVQTSRPADVGTFSTAKLQISLFLCKFIRKNLCFHL